MKRIAMLLSILMLLVPLVLCSCGATAPVTLLWTNPSLNVAPGTCNASSAPLMDLKQATFYGRIFGRSDSVLLATRAVRAGVLDSFTVSVQETLWDFWGFWFDSTGNRSCASNMVRKRVGESPAPGIVQ